MAFINDLTTDHWLRERIRDAIVKFQEFETQHGPDEPMLRDGKLTPVGELIAKQVARLLEL